MDPTLGLGEEVPVPEYVQALETGLAQYASLMNNDAFRAQCRDADIVPLGDDGYNPYAFCQFVGQQARAERMNVLGNSRQQGASALIELFFATAGTMLDSQLLALSRSGDIFFASSETLDEVLTRKDHYQRLMRATGNRYPDMPPSVLATYLKRAAALTELDPEMGGTINADITGVKQELWTYDSFRACGHKVRPGSIHANIHQEIDAFYLNNANRIVRINVKTTGDRLGMQRPDGDRFRRITKAAHNVVFMVPFTREELDSIDSFHPPFGAAAQRGTELCDELDALSPYIVTLPAEPAQP